MSKKSLKKTKSKSPPRKNAAAAEGRVVDRGGHDLSERLTTVEERVTDLEDAADVVDEITWDTKDRGPVRIVDMDDGHLLNTIHMLRRHHRAKMDRWEQTASLDEIAGSFGDAWDFQWSSPVPSPHPALAKMEEVASWRGLPLGDEIPAWLQARNDAYMSGGRSDTMPLGRLTRLARQREVDRSVERMKAQVELIIEARSLGWRNAQEHFATLLRDMGYAQAVRVIRNSKEPE